MGPPRVGRRLAKLGGSRVPLPRKKTGKNSRGKDDDCVVLDGDPHRPAAVLPSGASDEVEIVAVKGEIACKDFPHSRHSCSEFPFGSTSHVKRCSMCYCFVCDAPAPCKYWGKGLSSDDHCHATDKETRWKTLRQAFKCKHVSASSPPKLANVVYPTMPSPLRQQEYYEDYSREEAIVCVRNLPYDIDNEDLTHLFMDAGNVMFSEIIYDNVKGQSCGYGFVTMSTVQEAEKAVELYHRRNMDGIPMTVSKVSSTRVSPAEYYEDYSREEAIVCVRNLPDDIDSEDLAHLFGCAGNVMFSEIIYDNVKGQSCGYGFVTMSTVQETEKAVELYHRRNMDGIPMTVSKVSSTRVSPAEYYEDYSREEAIVCVRNLPDDIDSEDLAHLFGCAGNVMFSEIIYENVKGQSCGYGFVTMSTVQEAEKAVELYHRRNMDGIPMTVSKVSSTRVSPADQVPSPSRSPFKIYMANIPWKTKNSSLKQLYSEYGEVVSAKVHHHGERIRFRHNG